MATGKKSRWPQKPRFMDYLIGIDPSLNSLGVAILTLETKQLELKTGSFLDMVEWLQERETTIGRAGFMVEDPNLTTRFWGAGAVEADAKKLREGRMALGEFTQKIRIAFGSAQDVGKNKAAATLFIEIFAGFKILRVDPAKRERADGNNLRADIRFLRMPTKTNAAQFCTLTGYEGRCSEHARDAATLVWGKSATQFNLLLNQQKQIEEQEQRQRKQQLEEQRTARIAGNLPNQQPW